MFGIGSTELVIILIVALVLIGPSKLPDLMKSLGKGLSEFRRMSTDVKSTLEREIERADEAKRIEETKKELFGDDEPAKAEARKDDSVKPAADTAATKASGQDAGAAGADSSGAAKAAEASGEALKSSTGSKPAAQEKSNA
ncbi:MAG: Sec-independent protein translocase protein TatB [Thermodesulfobacteriota bacterium]